MVNQAPDLVVQYKDSLGQYSQMIPYKTGDWSYGDYSAMEGGMSNAALDGQKPQEWVFSEYTTVKRTTFDTVKLVFAPQPDNMTVTMYRQDDPEDTGTEIPVSEDGEITLEGGDVNMIYVVTGDWQSEHYQGSAIYWLFAVTTGQKFLSATLHKFLFFSGQNENVPPGKNSSREFFREVLSYAWAG